MRYLIEPGKNGWVGVSDIFAGNKSENAVKEHVKREFANREMWLADLDGTITNSVAQEIACKALGTDHFDPKFLSWCLNSGAQFLYHGESAKGECWENYVSQFLGTRQAKKEIWAHLNKPVKFFPGVEDFYGSIPGLKILVTRNVREVAKVYSEKLGLTDFLSESHDKADRTTQLLQMYTGFERFGVSGNSQEDFEMVSVVRNADKQVVSLYVASSPRKCDERFDVIIGHDYRGLVSLLKD